MKRNNTKLNQTGQNYQKKLTAEDLALCVLFWFFIKNLVLKQNIHSV